MLEKAMEEAQKACELSDRNPTSLGILGLTYGLAGRHADALTILEELMAGDDTTYVPPYAMAAVYRGLGEIDEALGWLAKGVDGRDLIVVGGLKSEPRYIVMRGHPRYQALLRKTNLES